MSSASHKQNQSSDNVKVQDDELDLAEQTPETSPKALQE